MASGEGGAVARLSGPRWEVPGGTAAECAPAQAQRGVVLARRDQRPTLHEIAEGRELAALPQARDAALAADLSVSLLLDGEVAMHRLATHLSLL